MSMVLKKDELKVSQIIQINKYNNNKKTNKKFTESYQVFILYSIYMIN